jgi:hypothetical protein
MADIKPGSLCIVTYSTKRPDIVGMECTVLDVDVTLDAANPDGSVSKVTGCVIELKTGERVITSKSKLLPIDPDPDADYTEDEEVKPREKVYVH